MGRVHLVCFHGNPLQRTQAYEDLTEFRAKLKLPFVLSCARRDKIRRRATEYDTAFYRHRRAHRETAATIGAVQDGGKGCTLLTLISHRT